MVFVFYLYRAFYIAGLDWTDGVDIGFYVLVLFEYKGGKEYEFANDEYLSDKINGKLI